jgi:CRP-like cAMP-binding protein
MAKVAKARDHRANRLLAALGPDDYAALAQNLEVVALPGRKVLYEPGETIEHAYFPHDAIISLIAVFADGGSVEMALFGCEGVVGFASSLVSRANSLGRYMVQVPGTASRIPVKRLRSVAQGRSRVQELLLRYTEALLAQTFQTVACNAVHSVEARCCRWILCTQDRVGREHLLLTHQFLADTLGVQRSTVSLIARGLQKRGLIEQRRGLITVANRAGLEEIACECYQTTRQTFERLLPHTYSRPSPSRAVAAASLRPQLSR